MSYRLFVEILPLNYIMKFHIVKLEASNYFSSFQHFEYVLTFCYYKKVWKIRLFV